MNYGKTKNVSTSGVCEMKIQRKIYHLFITGVLAVLTACSASQTTLQSTALPPAQVSTETQMAVENTPESVITEAAPLEPSAVTTEQAVEATPTMDVDALIREKLQGHHDISRVYSAHHTREEWNATLDRMISYGAQISEEEKQIIIDYLMSRQQ
jgi:hypothetical protein